MNKRYILKSNDEIASLVHNKESVGNSYYAIYYKKVDEVKPKIAISTSKKLGSSPTRNKERRRIREIIRNNCLASLAYFNVLVVVKEKSINLEFKQKEKVIIDLINKIKEKK